MNIQDSETLTRRANIREDNEAELNSEEQERKQFVNDYAGAHSDDDI